MREIKFRQWLGKNGWHYFGLSEGKNEYPVGASYETNPVMQYTGLKDKNGKNIYEGDIVRQSFSNWVGDVRWSDWNAHFAIYNGDNGTVDVEWFSQRSTDNDFEILGNIYENPELIEDK